MTLMCISRDRCGVADRCATCVWWRVVSSPDGSLLCRGKVSPDEAVSIPDPIAAPNGVAQERRPLEHIQTYRSVLKPRIASIRYGAIHTTLALDPIRRKA